MSLRRTYDVSVLVRVQLLLMFEALHLLFRRMYDVSVLIEGSAVTHVLNVVNTSDNGSYGVVSKRVPHSLRIAHETSLIL